MDNLPASIPERESGMALVFELSTPPEPFEDEFPMIGQYMMLLVEGKPVIYIPEDDEIISDPEEQLFFIMRCAPITEFHGAVGVTINKHEE
jgi:hypothetical protein